MSAELALISGLGITAFMTLKLLESFKQADSMIEETVTVLAILFLIGLQYAAHGIATSQSLSNAADAYLVTLLITVLIFFGIIVELANRWRKENQEETLGGFQLSR